MAPKTALNRRLRLAYVFAAVAFALTAIGQARVQLFSRSSILKMAEDGDRLTVTRTDYAKRGKVFSADGKPLAQDDDTHELTINFNKVPDSPAFMMDLAMATGVPASELQHIAQAGIKTRVWKDPVSSATASKVQTVKSRWRADGISLARSGRRYYPLGVAAAGVVGAVREGQPTGGLELSQNKLLGGENGKTVGLVDRFGSYLPMFLSKETEPRQDGLSITLTLDSELQTVAASAIRQAVEVNNADQGSAIIMDPTTGDILAMANWPSYDPNRPWLEPEKGKIAPDVNSAYMAALEPGSTFKILTLAKALEDKVLRPDESTYCTGGITVGKRTMKCDAHHGNRAHGRLSPELAIAKSCNVSAATWSLRVGVDPFKQYLKDLGLLEKTQLGLPNEGRPLFNHDDYAKRLQLATLGFGQSINTTPVQLCDAFTMLANEGVRMKPRLIKMVGDKELPPVEAQRIVSKETAATVLKFMESVIESDAGTGHSLRIPGYRMGGKTGTAEKRNGVSGGGYVSNFVGFVPAQKPQAVILVMVDHPKAGKYYGASVAGPVFMQLASSVIRRFGIPPQTVEGQ